MLFSLVLPAELTAAEVQVSPDLALPPASTGQYHIGGSAVSPAVFRAVSAREPPLDTTRYLQADPALEAASDQGGGEGRAQYHRDPKFRIALGLGAVYVVFLAGWFWATRVRPRRR